MVEIHTHIYSLDISGLDHLGLEHMGPDHLGLDHMGPDHMGTSPDENKRGNFGDRLKNSKNLVVYPPTPLSAYDSFTSVFHFKILTWEEV